MGSVLGSKHGQTLSAGRDTIVYDRLGESMVFIHIAQKNRFGRFLLKLWVRETLETKRCGALTHDMPSGAGACTFDAENAIKLI